MNQICKLCNVNVADKMNSHIIPKFMCKGLFEDVQPRHSIEINRTGKARKIQDTSKENNLFCTSCEKRISILETYFSKRIIDIHNYGNVKDRIDLVTIEEQQYLICKNIKPIMFKLFIYSLVWRSSVSKLPDFEKFNIGLENEESLRIFLDKNLTSTHKQLFESIESIKQFPQHDFCVIKPSLKTKQSRGIFTAFNAGESTHVLMVVDFAIFFYTDDNSADFMMKFYSNKQNEKVIIAMGEIEKWKGLNQLILDKMFEK